MNTIYYKNITLKPLEEEEIETEALAGKISAYMCVHHPALDIEKEIKDGFAEDYYIEKLLQEDYDTINQHIEVVIGIACAKGAYPVADRGGHILNAVQLHKELGLSKAPVEQEYEEGER